MPLSIIHATSMTKAELLNKLLSRRDAVYAPSCVLKKRRSRLGLADLSRRSQVVGIHPRSKTTATAQIERTAGTITACPT